MKKIILLSILLIFLLLGAFLYSKMDNTILFKDYEVSSIILDGIEYNIYYEEQNGKKKDDLSNTLEDLQEAKRKWFPSVDNAPSLPIYLLDENSDHYSSLFNNGISGFYNVEQEAIYLDTSKVEFMSVFTHEYSHYLFHQTGIKSNVDIDLFPDWFVEGLANSFEWSVTKNMPKSVVDFDNMKFEELNTMSNKNRATLYSQGFYAVMDLIDMYGSEIIERLITTTGEMDNFEKAFSKETALNLSTYHEKFYYDSTLVDTFYKSAIENPTQFITSAKDFLSDKAEINQYSYDLYFLLLEAHQSLGHSDKTLHYAQLVGSLSSNPLKLLNIAKMLLDISSTEAEKMVQKAILASEAKGYNTEEIKQMGNEILSH